MSIVYFEHKGAGVRVNDVRAWKVVSEGEKTFTNVYLEPSSISLVNTDNPVNVVTFEGDVSFDLYTRAREINSP